MRKVRKKKLNKALIAAAAGALLLAAALFCAGIAIRASDKSFSNLFVGDTSVGSMTESEILSALDKSGWESRACSNLTVETYCGCSVEINPVLSGVSIDAASAAKSAVNYGKEGSPFKVLFSFFKNIFSSADLNELESALNEEYISSGFRELQSALDLALSYDSYYIDEENARLEIIKGYGEGLSLDESEFISDVVSAFESGSAALEFKSLSKEPVSPDFSALHSLVCTGPVDAAFSTDGSHEIIAERAGYEFDEEELRSLWESAAPGEKISIGLDVSYSDITSEYLQSMMYRDLLGAMTTKYNNSGENRSSNVRLATSLVNGTEIYPEEVFSFNETVGKRTEEAGFLLAPAYAGYDDIQEEIGGGVCQVSTGIYASALYAFLEITSHTCHVYPPNYIQLGTDATVSIPESGREIDLKITNNKSYPIKIVGYCEETTDPETGDPLKTVTIEIWGTLEDDDYMPIEFDNAYADIYDYDRKIEPAYEGREGYRLQFTHDETEFEDDIGKGLRTLTYMRIYDSSGNLVDKRILNPVYSFGYGMDTYYYIQ